MFQSKQTIFLKLMMWAEQFKYRQLAFYTAWIIFSSLTFIPEVFLQNHPVSRIVGTTTGRLYTQFSAGYKWRSGMAAPGADEGKNVRTQYRHRNTLNNCNVGVITIFSNS